jgi:hypothetical protein
MRGLNSSAGAHCRRAARPPLESGSRLPVISTARTTKLGVSPISSLARKEGRTTTPGRIVSRAGPHAHARKRHFEQTSPTKSAVRGHEAALSLR